MKELNQILGIETRLSTAIHSQIDGQTEHMKSEVRTVSPILCRL